MTLMLSMPPLSGVKRDMDMEIEFDFYEVPPLMMSGLRLLYIWTLPLGSSSC